MTKIFVIKRALLGSYICFITTSLDTVDTGLLLRLCTTCQYQTTATITEGVVQVVNCTVHGLKYMCL